VLVLRLCICVRVAGACFVATVIRCEWLPPCAPWPVVHGRVHGATRCWNSII
jgi:hypothetical protein